MSNPKVMQKIFDAIAKERKAQDKKWGEQNHRHERWLVILTEEVGEVAKEILECNYRDELIKELIQVAAVAMVWVEMIERRNHERS